MKSLRSFFLLSVAIAAVAPPAWAQPLNVIRGFNDATGQPAPGADLVRHWIAGANTQCNDGSSSAAYVRRAQNAANRDNWIIYLEGGGSCDDGDDCVARWQSFANNFGMQKMSSSVPIATWQAWHGAAAPAPAGWTAQGANFAIPTGIVGNGIFTTAAVNPFRAWNKVFVRYCSSDSWTGQQPLLATSGIDQRGTPPTGVLPGTVSNYDIEFNGAGIFDQIVADLRAGLVYCLGANCETMPSLNDASMLLLAGSSAGANGVKHNLDRLRADQLSHNAHSQVRGVIDAAGSPHSGNLPWPVAPAPMTSYQDRIDQTWADVYVGFWNARVDDSCVAENAVGTASRCADNTHVYRHHVTTPFFHRMDLQDNLALENYVELFYPVPAYPPFVAPTLLSAGVVQQLREFGAFGDYLAPRYPNELASIAADPQWLSPGVFGPRCTDHVGLTVNRTFFNQELQTPAGALINYADALFDWVNTAPTGLGGATGPVLIAPTGIGPAGFAPCN